jgi:hypothetical protein
MNNEYLKSNKKPKMKTSVCIAAKGGIVPEAPPSDPGFNTEGKRSAHHAVTCLFRTTLSTVEHL